MSYDDKHYQALRDEVTRLKAVVGNHEEGIVFELKQIKLAIAGFQSFQNRWMGALLIIGPLIQLGLNYLTKRI